MTRRVRPSLVLALLVAGAPACASDHLVFTTSTRFGVDISATNGVPSSLVFGYKRFEGACIPVDPQDVDEQGNPRMMAVFSSLDLENGWFSGIDLFQVFATGEAAVKAASDGGKLAEAVAIARGGEDDR